MNHNYNPGPLPAYPQQQLPKPYRPSKSRIFFVPFLAMLFHLVVMNVIAVIVIIPKFMGSLMGDILNQKQAGVEDAINQLLDADTQAIIMIVSCSILIPLYALYIYLHSKKQRDYFPNQKISPRSFSLSFFVIFASMGFVNIWILVLEYWQNTSKFISDKLVEYADLVKDLSGDGNLILSFISVVILVPIAEELLFRGIIMNEFRGRMRPFWVISIQALLFALFHLNFVQSSYVIYPGIALGIIYYLSDSFYLPVLMHMLFNFIGGIVPQLFPDDSYYHSYMLMVSIIMILPALIYLIISWPKLKATKINYAR